MCKLKSVFVTAIVAVMLGIIVFAAYKLLFPAFVVIVGGLSGVGYICGATAFCRWLEAEREPELPKLTPVVVGDPVNLEREPDLGSDFAATYDEIKREVEAGL